MTPTTPTPRSQRADRVLICRPFRAAYPSERRLTAPSYGPLSPNCQPSAAGLVSFVSMCESRIAPSATLRVGSAGTGREAGQIARGVRRRRQARRAQPPTACEPNSTDGPAAFSHLAGKLGTARVSERRDSSCGARPRSRIPGLRALGRGRNGHPTCERAGSPRRSRRGALRMHPVRIRREGQAPRRPLRPPQTAFRSRLAVLLARPRYASSSNSTYSASTGKAHPPSGERVRPSSYAWPSLSWPANRVRQVPDARGVRRKRGVFTNFEASSDSRAPRRRSTWRSR